MKHDSLAIDRACSASNCATACVSCAAEAMGHDAVMRAGPADSSVTNESGPKLTHTTVTDASIHITELTVVIAQSA